MTSLLYLRDLPSKMRAASHDRNGLSPSFFPKILAMRFFNFTRSSAGPKRNGYRTAFFAIRHGHCFALLVQYPMEPLKLKMKIRSLLTLAELQSTICRMGSTVSAAFRSMSRLPAMMLAVFGTSVHQAEISPFHKMQLWNRIGSSETEALVHACSRGLLPGIG